MTNLYFREKLYDNEFCFNTGTSEEKCRICSYNHWSCLMICNFCKKFECECKFSDLNSSSKNNEKNCLFCNFKTWEKKETTGNNTFGVFDSNYFNFEGEQYHF